MSSGVPDNVAGPATTGCQTISGSAPLAIVRGRYVDFGPPLAHEKLLELHDIRIGRETLRKWLTAAGNGCDHVILATPRMQAVGIALRL